MRTDLAPSPIHLKDYQPSPWLIDRVDLRFELFDTHADVAAVLAIRRNPDVTAAPLALDGEDLELLAVAVDGVERQAGEYELSEERLLLDNLPDDFLLSTRVRIYPQQNTQLSGLYQSSGNFCTQCEAEGFRRITYFIDRPDIMSRYRTTIVADAAKCPVLLSNGNLVESGSSEGGRHYAVWEDPFRKPCYLFALVAGDLHCTEDTFVTRSQRPVKLQIFVEHQNADKVDFAMASLHRAMRWDEEVFGLEYDLDVYMIVAVNDFNMGAMENKGLNIFNSKYVLARPETATDTDFEGVEAVIAHEYFHNWTGNRITCRDWFQLSLKEGLTVFRDQEFTADMTSRAVKRINDVKLLRMHQFREDAGPMAHPVRPESYVEINNFYTVTIYEKGAEVIRMMYTLLGHEGFHRGMKLYFQRHDGCAVTCDDFLAAMEDANGMDLSHFRLWYSQAGTPVVDAESQYDATTQTLNLTLRQNCPATPGQADKSPMHIPVAVGLISENGHDLPLILEGESPGNPVTTRVIELRECEHSFRFINVPENTVPSLLRNFSAPIKINYPYSDADLAFLWSHDSDSFNRWEAGQRYMVNIIRRLIQKHEIGLQLVLDEAFVDAFGKTLLDNSLDAALKTQALSLPSESMLLEELNADIESIHFVRDGIRRKLAEIFESEFLATYQTCHRDRPYQYNSTEAGARALKNLALGYLMELGTTKARDMAMTQIRQADNMTDESAALTLFANSEYPERTQVLEVFYEKWQHDPLVMDKWFSIQATSRRSSVLQEVRELLLHPGFDIKNPNKVRSLIGAFAHNNPLHFHAKDGSGYAFVAEQVILLDSLNPQVAARLAGALGHWRRQDPLRAGLMRQALEQIQQKPDLSRDVFEIVAKSLA